MGPSDVLVRHRCTRCSSCSPGRLDAESARSTIHPTTVCRTQHVSRTVRHWQALEAGAQSQCEHFPGRDVTGTTHAVARADRKDKWDKG